MKLLKIFILLNLLLFGVTFVHAKEVIVASGHHDYPPVMWHEGDTIKGVSAELVKEIVKRLELDVEIKYVGPWKRVQEYAREGRIDLIIGCYSNNERRSYMDYTVPYMEDPTSIFVNKNNNLNLKDRNDLIGKRGSTMHGDSFGEEMDQFIQKKLNITSVYSAEANLKNLVSGNVDYILWGYYPCMINAKRFGYDDDIKAIKPALAFENMYMAFSKRSKFKHLIPKVNRIINELKKQGLIDEMISTSFKEYTGKYITDVE